MKVDFYQLFDVVIADYLCQANEKAPCFHIAPCLLHR